MDTEGSVFKLPISLNTFPAKLWKLVNDPHNSSVTWSPNEDGVIINQQQFEIELMLPVKQNHKLFKTTNFHSFIRQLNLYGFRKMLDDSSKARQFHHFYNPNFRKDQPELLVNLKRLTINNRVKMCGEKEMDWAPRPIRRKSEHSTADEKQGSVHLYQYHGTESHQLRSHDPTLIPSHPLIFHYGDVSPFYIDKGIPVSVLRRCPPDISHGFAFSPNTMLLHQEPKYIPVPLYSPYTPRYFPPAICQCSRSCFMDVDRTGFGQYSFAPYGYFQNYSVNEPHVRNQTQDWIPKDRGDINLDTVFQMVDEFQGLSNVDIVQVDSPVKPQHTFGLSDPSGSAFYTLPALSELESLNDQSSRPNTVSLSSVPSLDSYDDGACRRSTDNINLEAYKQYNDIMSKYTVNQVLHSSSKERIITAREGRTLGK